MILALILPAIILRTMKADNVTSSWNTQQKSEIEEELLRNQTSVITEENESFQEQFSGTSCQEEDLLKFSHSFCGEAFHSHMMSISTEKWCELDSIIRQYNDMTLCLEKLSHLVDCFYPNPSIQDFFLSVHSLYFSNCSQEEQLHLLDAPQGLVLILTLLPVSLIPILVSLVVWRSKVHH